MRTEQNKQPDTCRRSWLEISGETLLGNYRRYQSLLPAGTEIMAVVKADAYGHGDGYVAKLLADHGVEHFGVRPASPARS